MEVSESQSPNLDIPKALTIILQAKLEIKGHIVLDKKKKGKHFSPFVFAEEELGSVQDYVTAWCELWWLCVAWKPEDM